MNYLYWLSQIQASEKFLVGNKLFILSQLLLDDYPIMPGFVLVKSLLQKFVKAAFSESLLSSLSDSLWQIDAGDYRILQEVARHSRQTIETAVFPPKWQEEIFEAARQLNSRAFILTPYLVTPHERYGINGLWRSQTCFLTPEALERAIKRVWQEFFTARSLLYYRQSGLSINKTSIAILVQPLRAVPVSGTVEISSALIRIRATEGSIQSILWGEVQPDTYKLDRTGKILEQQLGNKNYAYRLRDFSEEQSNTCLEAYLPDENRAGKYSLNAKAIAKLFESIAAILHHQPQTKYLEWVLEPNQDETQFYITQLSDRLLWSIDQKKSIRASSAQPLLTGLAASAGSVLASATVIADLNHARTQAIPSDCILITKNVPPEQIPVLKRIRGIIIEEGGITSHGAIVARELKIPAIVAAKNATKIIATGQEIFLNGDTGEVYPEKLRPLIKVAEHSRLKGKILTKLMVNLSQPETIDDVVDLAVDGVGLLRSELMLSELLASEPLEVWQQRSKRSQFREAAISLLERFASAFAPRPVFYRSLDLFANQTKRNPIVSSRGTYKYLFNSNSSNLFDLELEALLTVSQNYSNLNLILPFVRSVAEFEFCRRRTENIGLSEHDSFQLWIMAEVPSVLFLLPQYVRAGVRGIAIGTNDLTQLLLGIDREQAHFSQQGLNETNPALQLAIAQLIQTAKANDIPCSVCGQAPAIYPELIERLVEWGITSISVEPQAVTATYEAISRAERRLQLN